MITGHIDILCFSSTVGFSSTIYLYGEDVIGKYKFIRTLYTNCHVCLLYSFPRDRPRFSKMSSYVIMFEDLVLLYQSKRNYYNGLNDGYGEILNLIYGDDSESNQAGCSINYHTWIEWSFTFGVIGMTLRAIRLDMVFLIILCFI